MRKLNLREKFLKRLGETLFKKFLQGLNGFLTFPNLNTLLTFKNEM